MRAAYVDKYPKAAKALLMAVMEAQQWCGEGGKARKSAGDLRQAAGITVRSKTSPIASRQVRLRHRKVVENSPHMMRFWADSASYPYQSHDLWFLTRIFAGQIRGGLRHQVLVAKVNREDLWKEAAGPRVTDIPASKSRGRRPSSTVKVFDPENPRPYLKSLSIKRV